MNTNKENRKHLCPCLSWNSQKKGLSKSLLNFFFPLRKDNYPLTHLVQPDTWRSSLHSFFLSSITPILPRWYLLNSFPSHHNSSTILKHFGLNYYKRLLLGLFASNRDPFQSVLMTTARVLSKTLTWQVTTPLKNPPIASYHLSGKVQTTRSFLSRLLSPVPIHILSTSYMKLWTIFQTKYALFPCLCITSPTCLERKTILCSLLVEVYLTLKS